MSAETSWDLASAIGSVAGGFAALAALLVAWYQLRSFVRSNRDATRPYLAIDVVFERQSSVDPKAEFRALAYVVVRNDGPSAARDIVLQSEPPFETKSTDVTEGAVSGLRKLFSGSRPIPNLNPGRELKYILDEARMVLRDDAVASYEVSAIYSDPSGHKYHETSVIAFEAWEWSAADEDPLTRISKDLQGVARAIREHPRS